MGVTSLFPPFTNIRFSVKKKSGSIHTDSRSGHVWSVANTAPYTSFSRLAGHRTRFFGTFFLLDRGLIFGNGHVACRSESQWFSGCFFEASQTSSGKIFTRTALKKYDASTRAGQQMGPGHGSPPAGENGMSQSAADAVAGLLLLLQFAAVSPVAYYDA